MTKALRCAIYTRKSTEEGLDQAFNSLDAQREACDAYVRSQAGEGWVALLAHYDDAGYSGGNMERPALRALLADIDRGLVDIVVVYKVDRLTRALADFGKIVERFDKRGVSFVSVTQAFNTTNSMGRLTLNMLLSFAQFEREVTSERIRDKLAASKKKGMWMGGRPPFGYRVIDKKIHPHETEAGLVRRIFDRYLELGSVRTLKEELDAQGVVSSSYVSRKGRRFGGKPFSRGALYDLLQNRIYIGEIRHKTQRYRGQHEGIVEPGRFEEVQTRLAEARRRELGKPKISVKHPLIGLVHDDAGNRMSPATGHGQNGKRFRYYVSQALIKGDDARKGEIGRISAEELEILVIDRIERLLGAIRHAGESTEGDTVPATLLHALIERIDLKPDSIVMRLRPDQLQIRLNAAPGGTNQQALQRRLPAGDVLAECDGFMYLTIAGGPVRRGGASVIQTPDGSNPLGTSRHDPALLKAVARAHGWLDQLLSGSARTLGDIAAREGIKERYVRRVIDLAFLSPEDLRAALDGRHSPHLTVDRVAREGLALAWG